ncbi:unnamed protein product [Rhizophagus irregularis]|nr:unnamed protein product [Rhizophagus irregularis]
MSGVFENDDNNLSDDSLASDDERIINKKLSADVWEFFQKIQDEESWLITNYKCILCAKLYSPGNPTSTLRRHLTKKHPSHYKKPETRQTTLRFKPYSPSKSKPITDSLVDFVATDLQPFTIVENPEFKLLINKLNPHYILPCRQTLKEKFIENYKMRKNVQILMQGVSELLATTNVEELGDLFPTISEWRHIKELAKVLEPMYEATNLLSSSKNPTQGDIRLVFNGMFKKLDHYQRGNHHTQKAIASAICNKLKAYWDKYLNQSSITSSILDPCYKTTLFSHNDITEIISKLQELYLSYLPLNNQTIPSAPARSSRDYFLNLLNPNNIRQEVSHDELDRYLNSPVDSNTGSLIWWKTYEKDYPVLSQIAKDYLTIQATSVPSERAFSISGLTISKTRNSPNFGSNSGSKPITVRFCTQTTSFWTENRMDRTVNIPTPEWALDKAKMYETDETNETNDVSEYDAADDVIDDLIQSYENCEPMELNLTEPYSDFLLNSAEMNSIRPEDLDEIGESSTTQQRAERSRKGKEKATKEAKEDEEIYEIFEADEYY